jgi:hypothetical protein
VANLAHLIQALASLLGAAEDDEPDADAEPSLGWTAGGSVGYSQLPHVLAGGYRGGTTGEYAVDDEGERDRSDYEPDHDNEPEWYLDGGSPAASPTAPPGPLGGVFLFVRGQRRGCCR